MVPPLTPEVTAQHSGVSFIDSPPPSGAPEVGPFSREGESSPASCSWIREVEGSSQPAPSTPAVDPTDPLRAPSLRPARNVTDRQIADAQRKARLVDDWRALVNGGRTMDAAVTFLRRRGHDVSRASLVRWERDLEAGGFAALIDQRRGHSGRRRRAMLSAANEVAALRAAYLVTNRTEDSGSVPEAIRLAARRGEIRPELADEFEARHRDGRGVPDALRREVIQAPAVVRQHRSPTEAALEFLDAPGSSMWIKDAATGQERFVRVGDVLEADDATINFHVCVPWQMGGCKTSERYGVKVARFQWLVAIDRASRFIPGWSYTMRPREAYRAEDVTALFHGVFRQHGVWKRLCLEQGVWKANQVTAMLDGLGIERMTAWSPHGKPFVEGLFGKLWTKLSDLPGQVGRYRGEMERTEPIVRSCREGASDPRDHFPMLGDVLPALARVCAEHNALTIHSREYGSWVPQERWLAQLAEAREKRLLRPLAPEAAWMFAPLVREWTVRGNTVGGSVEVMEGASLQWDFAAEWLVEFAGARVRAHWDPTAPVAEATLVLLDNVRDHQAGEVLGTAVQVNKTTRITRRALGWGDDTDEAMEQRKVAAAGMRSTVRTLLPHGQAGYTRTMIRDGLGNAAAVEIALPAPDPSTPPSAPPPRPPRPPRETPIRRGTNPLAPSTPDQFRRRGGLLAKLAAAERALAANSAAPPILSAD